MTPKITCLVTLHGVGFEQPPKNGHLNDGYADSLHVHLKNYLGSLLSDDPGRERQKPDDNGPIYVESCKWNKRSRKNSREEGLKRLGTWCDDKISLNIADTPLINDSMKDQDRCVSHIALVYSNLETTGAEVGVGLVTLAMALSSITRYASAAGLWHILRTMFKRTPTRPQPCPNNSPISSLPRTDMDYRHKPRVKPAITPTHATLFTVLRNLVDDVGCYICENDERERVRSFVREALVRLASYPNVENIILNTHSNGTVIAFDVLRDLPADVARRIKVFVTAGSPLRKYVDLFQWGHQIQYLYPIERWYNFYDKRDPVADPLKPPITWHVGDPIPKTDKTLFSRIDPKSEQFYFIPIEDCEVDNCTNSCGGGLQAHNYWDNEKEFVRPLARIVEQITQGETPTIEKREHVVV